MNRIIISRRKRTQSREPGHTHRRDRGLGAAADHRIGIATLNDLEAVTDSVRPG